MLPLLGPILLTGLQISIFNGQWTQQQLNDCVLSDANGYLCILGLLLLTKEQITVYKVQRSKKKKRELNIFFSALF